MKLSMVIFISSSLLLFHLLLLLFKFVLLLLLLIIIIMFMLLLKCCLSGAVTKRYCKGNKIKIDLENAKINKYKIRIKYPSKQH